MNILKLIIELIYYMIFSRRERNDLISLKNQCADFQIGNVVASGESSSLFRPRDPSLVLSVGLSSFKFDKLPAGSTHLVMVSPFHSPLDVQFWSSWVDDLKKSLVKHKNYRIIYFYGINTIFMKRIFRAAFDDNLLYGVFTSDRLYKLGMEVPFFCQSASIYSLYLSRLLNINQLHLFGVDHTMILDLDKHLTNDSCRSNAHSYFSKSPDLNRRYLQEVFYLYKSLMQFHELALKYNIRIININEKSLIKFFH